MNELLVFGGPASMTEEAVINSGHYNDVELEYFKKPEDALQGMDTGKQSFLPMWNLYYGEVDKCKFFEWLESGQICINNLEVNEILFSCCSRNSVEASGIISVNVAEQQCSDFIESLNEKFISEFDTLIASQRFEDTQEIRRLLCTSRKAEELSSRHEDVIVEHTNVSNRYNYTVFGEFGKGQGSESAETRVWLITMPGIQGDLTDSQSEFFTERLLGDLDDDFSLCCLIADNEDGYTRILIECNYEIESPPPDDDVEVAEVGQNINPLVNRLRDIVDVPFTHASDSAAICAYPRAKIFVHGFSKCAVNLFSIHLAELLKERLSQVSSDESREKIQGFADWAVTGCAAAEFQGHNT